MKRLTAATVLLLFISACSNAPELEPDELQALKLITKSIGEASKPKIFIDARKLVTREQIDAANVPILFVELETGQNGTLTRYPGNGDGETWLGIDGATITFDQGILKASRGMGDDVMGAHSYIPSWSKIGQSKEYSRNINYLNGNNQIYTRVFKCSIEKGSSTSLLKIWEVQFDTTVYTENCIDTVGEITNIYYLDKKWIVRKSFQFHSETLGYLVTERLDK